MQKKFGFKKITVYKNYKINHFLSFLFIFLFLTINFVYQNIILADKKINFSVQTNNSEIASIAIDINQLNYYIKQKQYYKIFEKDILNNLLEKTSQILYTNINIENINLADFVQFIEKILPYKKDLYNVLYPGKKYAIILQNCGENRPGGGFFGSIAILAIYNTGFDIKFEDIYRLYYLNTGNKIHLSTQRAEEIIKKDYINIVDSKILGFSNKDFKNFKQLYEKTSNTKINGIISINSCFLENISPKIREKIYTRQFINSSINLIDPNGTGGKKRMYLQDIHNFFKNEKKYIIGKILQNLSYGIKNNFIKLYLPETSPQFRYFLLKENLADIQKKDNFYFFDFNIAFNKIDRFVEKTIYITDMQENIYKLDKNQYSFKAQNKIKKIIISYQLNIPSEYINLIYQLQNKYKIKLQNKQKHILGVKSFFKNRGIIILPENLKYKGKNYIIYEVYLDKKRPFKNLVFNIEN